MKRNLKTLKYHESISEELKYVANSSIRFKILKALYECPSNMRDINIETGLNYSAISVNMHMLEIEQYIYRLDNLYFLSNAMKLCMGHLLELTKTMNVLNSFAYVLENHVLETIPENSLNRIYNLENAELIESDGLNIYKTYEFIENTIKNAKYVNAIFPFYYSSFNAGLNRLVNKDLNVNLLIPLNIKKKFDRTLNYSKSNLSMRYFDDEEDTYFLLINTDKTMVLGLFKVDGTYDQNRLLTSTSPNCLKWARMLFDEFESEYINE